MFVQIVDAVKYIHSRNICHRDLKLENILLDDSNSPKLCDFGFCGVQTSNAHLRTPCGSPLYTAPEIFSQGSYDGMKADIWSLGVVLYTLCAGARPWVYTNYSELVDRIRYEPINFPLSFGAVLLKLLFRMFARSPGDRCTIDDVLASEWLAPARHHRDVGSNHAQVLKTVSIPISLSCGPDSKLPGAKPALRGVRNFRGITRNLTPLGVTPHDSLNQLPMHMKTFSDT